MTATAPRPRPPAAARTTYRSVFAAGEFRVLFAAILMYVLGFEFEILGLSVLVHRPVMRFSGPLASGANRNSNHRGYLPPSYGQ
jgi:hypothetical protein